MKSKILNPKRMKQLIDFKGLELDNGIYPTDIDGLIEYHDSEYILLEVKHKDARVPYGQRLAIQRMVDDFTKAGKKAVAIVCEHKVDDTDKPVVAAFCKVRELYYGGEHKWRPPDSPMNVRQAIDKFRKYAKQHKEGWEEVPMEITLYSTGCPKCKVLKKKLEEKGIKYTENNSVDEMLSLGISQVPVLSVNNKLLDFSTANNWVNQQ